MTESAPDLDLTNLPRFLEHLGHPNRDPGAAAFAYLLLDQGCEVETFWGPQQMDVWRLTLRRGRHRVTFGVERGFPDWVGAGAAGQSEWKFAPLWLAVLGWARATQVDLVFDDPDSLRGDFLAHGVPALDWLDAGNDEALARTYAAWREYRHGDFREARRDSERMREMKARGIRLIEEAAAPQ